MKRTFGAPFTLTGGISSAEGSCAAGQTVEILRTVLGEDSTQPFDVLTSGADGTFSGSYDADRGANYVAHVDGSPKCAEANSDTEPVLVRVKVSLRLSDNKVRRGQRIALRTKVAPCSGHDGTIVTLLKAVRGRLTKVASARLSGSCTARWTQRVKKPTTFEVRWDQQHPDHLAGRSQRKPVRVI
ncbi:MAG TPA: hypothetical protein VNC78_10550 [Actinomycetota bacterium]|nr:hypothetical protein [Actinomycetota bacterium]